MKYFRNSPSGSLVAGPDRMGLRDRLLGPALLLVGAVVSVVSSLGAPLIPLLAVRVGASVGTTQWALTATVLVAAVAAPVIGRLGDTVHRKQVLLTCLTLVTTGGAMAALATSLAPLIAGRALQGLGLALLPLVMAVARDHMPEANSHRLIGALSVVGAAGMGLGYPLTGAVAERGGVAEAYWVASGITATTLFLAWWIVPTPPASNGHPPLDGVGAMLLGGGLVSLLIGLDRAPVWGWGSGRVVLMLCAALLLMTLWANWELRVPHPLVDLSLLRLRPVLAANVSALLVGIVMVISMVLVTQFIQLDDVGLGQSVLVAGLALVPLSVLSTSVSLSLPWLSQNLGRRTVIPVGSLVVSLGAATFALGQDHIWQVLITTGVLGVGLGCTFGAMPGLIVGVVPKSETSSALGFYQVARYIGFAIGSGLAVALLRTFSDAGVVTTASYLLAALAAAGLGLLAGLVAWFLLGAAAD